MKNVQPEAPLPPRVELTQAHDHSEYLLHGKSAILSVLRAMMKARDLVTAYLDEGDDFLLTTVLAVDDGGIVFDYARSEETNRRAIAAEKLVMVASHAKVKIQFSLRGLALTEFEGQPALRSALPEKLLRLQRREFYRLTTPSAQPLKCVIRAPQAEDPDAITEVQVLDLSGGGVAIVAPPPDNSFKVDARFKDCQLELPEFGVVQATLVVRNVFEITQRSGARFKRCGCEFANLSGTAQSRIERYIMRVERERKARENRRT